MSFLNNKNAYVHDTCTIASKSRASVSICTDTDTEIFKQNWYRCIRFFAMRGHGVGISKQRHILWCWFHIIPYSLQSPGSQKWTFANFAFETTSCVAYMNYVEFYTSYWMSMFLKFNLVLDHHGMAEFWSNKKAFCWTPYILPPPPHHRTKSALFLAKKLAKRINMINGT